MKGPEQRHPAGYPNGWINVVYPARFPLDKGKIGKNGPFHQQRTHSTVQLSLPPRSSAAAVRRRARSAAEEAGRRISA
jgi:hypothetical protein